MPPNNVSNASENSKVVIVTGASRGIGRGIALRLSRDGMRVLGVGRDESALRLVAEMGERRTLAVDLRAPESAEKVVRTAIDAYGRVDALVNCAGATQRGEFLSLSDSDWAEGFAVKFEAAVKLSRAAWPHLRATRGSIVNIIGSGARTPSRDFTIGSAVNGALLAFTKALADLGVDEHVQVVGINPGPVQTQRLERRIAEQAARDAVTTDEAAQRMVKSARITRFGTTDDIAGLVAFVLSRAGAWLQGAIIDMDGGQTKAV
jgi:NAD(P)-dependent dehydrogenase (short-subunit alcohol dehydrogenase family)